MTGFWNPLWQLIRGMTPAAKRWVRVQGFEVRDPRYRVADTWFARSRKWFEDQVGWENAAVQALRAEVASGDDVTIVGGGIGITALVAARQGARRVRIIEPSRHRLRIIENNFERNGFRDVLEVRQGHVGGLRHAWGSAEGSIRMPIHYVLDCDVLEMDCEGAELAFLSCVEDGQFLPRCMIVESHEVLDSPKAAVESQLSRLYEIVRITSEDGNVATLVAISPRVES